MDTLGQILDNLWTSAYVQQNPNKSYKNQYNAEYTAIAQYISGGTRPNPANYSKMGKVLVGIEDQRRAAVGTPVPPDPPTGVVKYASLTGSDSSGDGSLAKPFATMDKLAKSLLPGETGQLRGGTYPPAFQWSTGEKHAGGVGCVGTASARCVITNYPGEKVTILGVWGFGGAFTTIRNLHFDPTNDSFAHNPCTGEKSSLVLTFEGKDLIFENNEISFANPNVPPTAASAIYVYDTAERLTVRNCLLHNFGFCKALDHGVYLGGGPDHKIYGNWIWAGLHGWGVQVYPNPKRAKIYSNVIDGCGSGVVICDDAAGGTVDCDVYNNVVSNATGLPNAATTGAGISGMGTNANTNNKFRDNIVWNCPAGIAGEGQGSDPPSNITITGNKIADPMFVDAANHDYRLKSGSPAANFGLPTTKPGPSV